MHTARARLLAARSRLWRMFGDIGIDNARRSRDNNARVIDNVQFSR